MCGLPEPQSKGSIRTPSIHAPGPFAFPELDEGNMMGEKLGRLRKPVSAVWIEVEMVFTSNEDFQKFGEVTWGRKSESVSGRKWLSARWEDEEDPESVIAVFQYVHTCRNEGAYRGDTDKFFRAVCKSADVSLDNAGILSTRLVHRIKCVEPVPERLPTPPEPEKRVLTAPVTIWGRPAGSDLGQRVFGQRA